MSAPPDKIIAAIDKLLGLPPVQLTSGITLVAMVKVLGVAKSRIVADAGWPSHQEELTRKATDTAHAVVHRLSVGELTREAAHAALGAIIDTASGLVDVEALDAINTAYRSLKS